MHLPCKQGRWGQWRDVTFLSNWLPVFAYHGDCPPRPGGEPAAPAPPAGFDSCWHPTPFIPWHQPFFNEAGNYRVRVHLPADQKVATTGTVVASREGKDGCKEVEIDAPGVRDFAFLCSACYVEHDREVALCPGLPPVRLHVLALPQHDHFAREMLRISAEALQFYSKWFGPYPYRDFTIAEAFFGWNGNECSTLVMIDERVFGMPHLASGYVEYLVSHEICHQWWYNMVGTNGFAETWMDEALATYFSHKLLDQKCGAHGVLMNYPKGLEWLPNIRRDDYRYYGMYGTIGRGEIGPCVQDMTGHGHVINLFSNCYDKGSKVVGMIEERLHGWEGFQPFMRLVFCKYQFRILRVADFQHELEAYTGQSWDKFFHDWLYGKGLSDWAVADVVVEPPPSACVSCWSAWKAARRPKRAGPPALDNPQGLTRVVVFLEQKAELNERTTLGFCLPGGEGYPVRIPIIPEAGSYTLAEPPAHFDCLGDNRFRVEVLLPAEPTQVTVDPDQLLVDRDPANNFWHRPIRFRFSPIYTFLDETDLTNPYDRWSVIWGPWIYGASYNSPWYTRATMIGARAGVYRTQEFEGGIYTAYRTDYRDVVAGVDGFWDHFPDCHWQVGFNAEQRLGSVYSAYDQARRAVAFGRYVFQYHSSLYLAPMEYLEGYTSYTDNFLPFTRGPTPGGERFDHATAAGLHYQLNYLTPYWDPEGGFLFDVFSEGGEAELNSQRGYSRTVGQFSIVKGLPNLTDAFGALPGVQGALRPVFDWLAQTRLAFHVYGGAAFPARGEFFTLGGSQMFRGFDMRERQGSSVWITNLEWRVPLAKGLTWDCFDHIMGVRNVYLAGFYDAGDTYVREHQVGPVAHAVGAGLRVDTAWFGFVERSVLRLDFAKALNAGTPMQVWFGFVQPF
jgi:hypothetical protein